MLVTLTATLPGAVPAGTVTTIVVPSIGKTCAGRLSIETVVDSVKLTPRIVMSVPPVTGPWFGEMLVICGVRSTAGGVAIGAGPRHAGRAVPAEVAGAPVGGALGDERQAASRWSIR